MAMFDNAKMAFEELKKLGVPVRDWGEESGYGDHVAFVLIWANDDSTEVFADYSGDRLPREQCVGGVRKDIHEILKKYRLVSDWDNPGQRVIYNDSDAPGFHHAWR